MNNVNEVSKRFLEAYEYLKETKKVSSLSEFAKAIGISTSMMTEIYKQRSNVGLKAIQNTVNEFKEFNSEWFLTGKGKMQSFKLPDQPKKDLDEEYAIKRIGIPLIPIDAMAGWGVGSFQIMDYETEKYVVPEFEELKVDFMIRVKGDSMYPKYSSGDLVACKKLPLDTFFQWNKVYVLDTIQGAMIKRIKKSEKEKHVSCVSENKDYDAFPLSLNDIHSLAIVVGVIRLE